MNTLWINKGKKTVYFSKDIKNAIEKAKTTVEQVGGKKYKVVGNIIEIKCADEKGFNFCVQMHKRTPLYWEVKEISDISEIE